MNSKLLHSLTNLKSLYSVMNLLLLSYEILTHAHLIGSHHLVLLIFVLRTEIRLFTHVTYAIVEIKHLSLQLVALLREYNEFSYYCIFFSSLS